MKLTPSRINNKESVVISDVSTATISHGNWPGKTFRLLITAKVFVMLLSTGCFCNIKSVSRIQTGNEKMFLH